MPALLWKSGMLAAKSNRPAVAFPSEAGIDEGAAGEEAGCGVKGLSGISGEGDELAGAFATESSSPAAGLNWVSSNWARPGCTAPGRQHF